TVGRTEVARTANAFKRRGQAGVFGFVGKLLLESGELSDRLNAAVVARCLGAGGYGPRQGSGPKVEASLGRTAASARAICGRTKSFPITAGFVRARSRQPAIAASFCASKQPQGDD